MKFGSGILFGVFFSAALLTGCASYEPVAERCGGSRNMGAPQGSAVEEAMPRDSAADNAVRRKFEVSKERKMAYRTSLVLDCQNVPEAIRNAGEIARKHHGYVAESDNFMIRVKIPVENADAALTELEALGKVSDRRISAQDITERYVDTQVRIGNLRKLHDKLTKLLDRAKNVDEILKVERELARVTTDLERYEAMMKNLALRTSLVDMTIRFHAVLPETAQGPMVPIPWIGALGTEISRREFMLNRSGDVPFKVDLPAGFAVLFSNEDSLYAVSPEDVVLKLSLRQNFRDADAAFYRAMIERALFSQNGYRKIASDRVDAGRLGFVTVTGDRQLGKSTVRYFAALTIHDRGWFCKDEMVALVELWGKSDSVQAVDISALLKSVRF